MISIIRKPHGRGLAWSAWCVASFALASMAQADVVSHNVVGAVNPLAGNTMQLDIVEVPIPAAIAARNNNALDGFTAYDFVVNADEQISGLSLKIFARDDRILTIYNVLPAFVDRDTPPDSSSFGSFPEAEYDTYVDVPGTYNGGKRARGDGQGEPVFGPDFFSHSWVDLDSGTLTDTPTDFVVARITLKVEAVPQSGSNVGNAIPFNQLPFFFDFFATLADNSKDSQFAITNTIPEPASLSLLGFGSLLLMRRRRA